MRENLLIALALLLPFAAHAGDAHRARFAVFGDQQFVTDCEQPSTAWTWGSAAASWVAGRGDVTAAIQVGDITMNASNTGTDCECLGTDPAPGACADIDHSVQGTGFCTECDNADAITCTGGTSGLLCEWTRARALIDSLTVPTLVTKGNHDVNIDIDGTNGWGVFNQYFGTADIPGAIESGYHIGTIDSGYPAAGSPLGADSYMVVSGAGQRWLIIQIDYYVDDESVAWAQGIIEQYPGMPTIIVSHMMHSQTTGWTYASMNGNGPKILASFGPYPQVFMYIGGHVSEMDVYEESSFGHKNIGVTIDYSYDEAITNHTLYDGVDSRQLEIYGGGGAVGMMTIDVVAGKVSWYVYSPQLDSESATSRGFDEHYPDASFWSTQIGFCDSSRFVMDAGACADYQRLASPRVQCTTEKE